MLFLDLRQHKSYQGHITELGLVSFVGEPL